jgi:hypothetical protein
LKPSLVIGNSLKQKLKRNPSIILEAKDESKIVSPLVLEPKVSVAKKDTFQISNMVDKKQRTQNIDTLLDSDSS